MEDGKVFVVMWDSEGLDGIANATELNQTDIFNALSGRSGGGLGARIGMMSLRARFNSHRTYEIYSIKVDGSIAEDDIAGWFEHNPQGAADLIRSKGKCLLSQKHEERKRVIT